MERGSLGAIIARSEERKKNNSLACEIYRNRGPCFFTSGHLHRRI